MKRHFPGKDIKLGKRWLKIIALVSLVNCCFQCYVTNYEFNRFKCWFQAFPVLCIYCNVICNSLGVKAERLSHLTSAVFLMDELPLWLWDFCLQEPFFLYLSVSGLCFPALQIWMSALMIVFIFMGWNLSFIQILISCHQQFLVFAKLMKYLWMGCLTEALQISNFGYQEHAIEVKNLINW